jgi:anthranilate/para-aminobenzoate synthase component I
MTEQEFFDLARKGFNRIPLVREMPGDLETPLSVYLKLANAPYSYLLESVVGGERFGRYSFIGLPARTVIRVRNHLLTLETDGKVVEEHNLPDPWPSSPPTRRASRLRRSPACRASPAGWPATSATTPSATSKSASLPLARKTCCTRPTSS